MRETQGGSARVCVETLYLGLVGFHGFLFARNANGAFFLVATLTYPGHDDIVGPR